MKKSELFDIFFQLIPLFFLLFISLFTKNEFLISIILIGMLLITFKIKYYKNEWKIFLFGIIIGFLFELTGSIIYKLQYWEQGTLFGMPIWLPLFWGYGFVFIRRIGNLIAR